MSGFHCLGFPSAAFLAASFLAAALLAAACEEVSYHSIEVSGLDSIMGFTADPQNSRTFTISEGMPWSIALENLDWMVVSPIQGDGRESVTVYMMPLRNSGGNGRCGTLVINPQKGQQYRSTVGQYPEGVTMGRQFFGLPGNVIGLDAGEETASFKFFCDESWTLDSSSLGDSFTVSPTQGGAFSLTDITVKAALNYDSDRKGRLSFVTSSGLCISVNVLQSVSRQEDALPASSYNASSTIGLASGSSLGDADNAISSHKIR